MKPYGQKVSHRQNGPHGTECGICTVERKSLPTKARRGTKSEVEQAVEEYEVDKEEASAVKCGCGIPGC